MSETLLLALRVALSLAAVLGLLWFLARRLGGVPGSRRQRPITVLARHSLSRRSGLAVVEIEGRRLLLGVSDSGVSLVTELSAESHGGSRVTADDDHGDDRRQERTDGQERGSPGGSAGQGPTDYVPAPSWDEIFGEATDAVPYEQHPVARHGHPPRRSRRPGAVVGSGSVDLGSSGPGSIGSGSISAPRRSAILHGSILAPSTWQRTWRVLQDRTTP